MHNRSVGVADIVISAGRQRFEFGPGRIGYHIINGLSRSAIVTRFSVNTVSVALWRFDFDFIVTREFYIIIKSFCMQLKCVIVTKECKQKHTATLIKAYDHSRL